LFVNSLKGFLATIACLGGFFFLSFLFFSPFSPFFFLSFFFFPFFPFSFSILSTLICVLNIVITPRFTVPSLKLTFRPFLSSCLSPPPGEKKQDFLCTQPFFVSWILFICLFFSAWGTTSLERAKDGFPDLGGLSACRAFRADMFSVWTNNARNRKGEIKKRTSHVGVNGMRKMRRGALW